MPPASTPQSRLKVLVVDDDEIQLMIVRAWLEDAGYTVVTRSTPFGTAAVVLREQPDIVILDVGMPGLAGDQLVPVIERLSHSCSVGIVFYSGKDEATLNALAASLPVLGAIRKTTSGAEFLRNLRRLTATSERPSSRRP